MEPSWALKVAPKELPASTVVGNRVRRYMAFIESTFPNLKVKHWTPLGFVPMLEQA